MISSDLHQPILYLIFLQIIATNSRTSNLWKLNADQTRIIEANPFHQIISTSGLISTPENDPIFNIITSTVYFGENWIKQSTGNYCTHCHLIRQQEKINSSMNVENDVDEVLDCGKPVNFTYYDNLVGVANRHQHPNVPEPQVISLFKKTRRNLQNYDINELERYLKRNKRDKPKSIQLYNQIGNFWRIKGDAEKSIECFRRALAVSPYNSEILLNLARLLFTLQYLDDAIYLTRRSIELQSSDKGVWQQYFTLGEILKAYGHYQEAIIHLKHAIDLKPDYQPALIALKEMENMPAATIHIYTLIIIICLVIGVLFVILSSVDGGAEINQELMRQQKHFNKNERFGKSFKTKKMTA